MPDNLYDILPPGVVPAVDIDPSGLANLLGYAPQSEPVVQPSQVPDAGLPNVEPSLPALPANSGLAPGLGGVGAGVSVSGYNPAANQAIQKGPHARLDRELSQDRARVEAGFAPLQEAGQEATQAAISAEDEAGDIESRKHIALSEGKRKISAANTDFLTKEQAAVENARAEADSIQGQYRTALADYAAAKINPAQLWDYAGVGGQVAMIATAFGHDFLAAKGINTSGMDSINRAIQNNISAQLENMRKKGDVAQGFKQLWDMQRAQSATDAEARQRMNGFYLSSLSNEIEAQLGGYDSELAIQKAQAAKAKLLQEQVKNDLLVRKHIDDAANQRADQRVRMYAAELSASSSKYSADAHLEAAKIAAGAKKLHPLEGVIFDTSKSGQNIATRRFLPDIPKDEQTKLRVNTAKVSDTAANIDRLIDLQAEAGKVPPTNLALVKKLQNEIARTAEALRTTVKMGIIYDNSGKQINEQEVKLYDELVAKNDWFTNGNNVRQLAQLTKTSLDKNNAIMRAVSTEIQPGDPAYGLSSGDKDFDQGASTKADIQSAPGAGRPDEGKTGDFKNWAFAPNAGQAFDVDKLPKTGPGSKPAVQKDWTQFVKDNPWAAPDVDNPADMKRRAGPAGKLIDKPLAANPEAPDRAFIQIVRLADLALQGDQQAKGVLDQLAAGKPGTADMDSLLSAYAQWEKSVKGL